MMQTKLFSFLLFFFLTIQVFSQEIPTIKVGNNTISVKKLNVQVFVIGDIAITTYDMQFYNPKKRVLEGELSFPLGENQSVTRFALDINGNLREAVVVEKEKARVAFESTVRNKIDPALLEQTKGNNYKARVYPIPAKGYKRVVVAFQQKLLLNNGSYFYKIPFNFKEKLDEFSLSIEVFNQKNKPISKKGMVKEFLYNTEKESYYAKINKVKTKVAQPVLIEIPLNTSEEKIITTEDYFYFSKQLNLEPKKGIIENEITVFWDASLSQKNKKIASEIDFLDAYFKRVKECKVRFVVFNLDVKSEKKHIVKNGNWNTLKKELEHVIYDGASSFNFLSGYKTTSKLNFLFTDGLNTLGDLNLEFNNKTYIINSASSANHIVLKNAATISGGKYINLQQVSTKNGFAEILTSQIQFLGTNLSEDELEVYPKKGSIINANFSIIGKGKFLNKKIEFYFGSGKDTVKSVSFFVKRKSAKNAFLSKIWAQNKLKNLTIRAKENRSEIVSFSKEHQIISPFTSMLILDRVEDYVTHSIEPPKELKEKFDALVAQNINNKKERIIRLQKGLFKKYEDFFSWFNKDYVFPEPKKVSENNSSIRNNENQITEVPQDTILGSGEFFVSGEVKDFSGALPGVSIVVKGTTKGTETDFDGKYKIKVKVGDELTFSYLGYKTLEKIISSNSNLNIKLQESGDSLDEIVVIGYGTRNSSNISASVSTVRAESISNALNGRIAGNKINGNAGATSSVTIRGDASLKGIQPLYVVDGRVIEDYKYINQKDIQSIYTLKPNQGKVIYGNRASNGVVVIVTKKGFDNDLEEIEVFEDLVKEKLELKGWNPKTPYLTILREINNNTEAYSKYIELREKYNTLPSFYIDVADFFKEKNEQKLATQILSNVAEIELDNYELLKALAYKFEQYNLYSYAVYIYEEILSLRPEDIQSYRDLALAYEQVGEYQKSLDLLYKIVNAELLEKDEERRFSGIEIIALNEMNRIINLYKKQLIISHIDKKYITNTQTDLRVLIDWNHNDTDIDLWVIDPKGEKCYYGHTKTKIGGLLSDDMTDGFGPEQFILKKAIKGNYKIKVKYYASDQQKISGPTFLKITTFKNYGFKNKIKKTQLVRLKKVDEVLDLGELIF